MKSRSELLLEAAIAVYKKQEQICENAEHLKTTDKNPNRHSDAPTVSINSENKNICYQQNSL